MKIRTDFVTNSSSSSFIVIKQGLSDEQIEAIKNPGETAEKYIEELSKIPYYANDDKKSIISWASDWRVRAENELHVELYTYIDNFDIEDLFKVLRIPTINYYDGE